MEDLLSLIVIVLYFVISASMSKKKKKSKKAERRADKKQPIQFEQAFERLAAHVTEEAKRKTQAIPEQKPQPVAHELQPGEGDDPCHEQMLGEERAALRVRNVAPSELAAAAEGEDPCHVGGFEAELDSYDQSTMERSPIFDTEDPNAFAQDVLRGVIMSEILTRPVQRHAASGMKRGA